MWRSLEELEGLPDDEGEFADGADTPDGWSRRTFLKLLGASAALAAAGCERSVPETILPYSVQPRGFQPGVPVHYATHWLHEGFAVGLLVKSNDGRPTKVEGNPDHPASLGGSGVWEQALVLGVYDPDRAASVRHFDAPSTWEALPLGGGKLRLLLEPTSSPTVKRLVDRLRERGVKATFSSPLGNTLKGAQRAFGRPLQPLYHVDRADVIVALDADLLCTMPFALRHARRWGERRRAGNLRMYAVECAPSPTGLAADHRLRRRSCELAELAQQLLGEPTDPFVAAMVRDLRARPRGTTLIVAGEAQPPEVHALALAANGALGNLGRTVTLIEPVLVEGDQDVEALNRELHAGQVDTLVMLGGNPAYTLPELEIGRARERIHLGAYENETAKQSTWFAPLTHPLEEWGDGRAYDGTLSLAQPLLMPFAGGRSVIEVLAMMAGDEPDGRKLVRATHPRLDIDSALRLGVVPGSAAPPVHVEPPPPPHLTPSPPPPLELNARLSPTIHDGRFANNAWLQELPEPITKLTWGNAVLLSPATASQRRLRTQDLVELSHGGVIVRGPVLVTPGHADDAVTVWLGYGRSGAESLAQNVGFDAYPLRHAKSVELRRVPGTEVLAPTQRHFSLHGRDIALVVTRDHPTVASDLREPQPSLMEPRREGLQWAMSIDLALCTGCSSCMLACQSENNLPVVGKQQVVRRRQMHWIRVDSYFHGSADDPAVVHQPMLCQHCELAPCEYVCPVNATVHSPDGLNEMVYNRCVGTRFCSNNCPYKVRRFNWFNWFKRYSPMNGGTYQLVHNPDVTVRDRGVMEKCSYCVQRIRRAEITARVENREIRAGEVVTACQQACPAGAIQFGSLTHHDSPVVKWREEPRAYAVLNDQNTRPRTRYLARLDNPNPEISK